MKPRSELRAVIDDVLASSFAAPRDHAQLWRTTTALDWHRVGIPEADGGAGGELADVAEIAAGVGRRALALPVIETGLAGWTLARAGVPVDVLGDEPAVAIVARLAVESAGGVVLDGRLRGVRFLPDAAQVVLLVPDSDRTLVVRLDRAQLDVRTHVDLAEEPIGDALLAALAITPDRVTSAPAILAGELTARAALLRAAALGGCVERAVQLVRQHVSVREQFGRPLITNQAVAHGVATIACERDLISFAVAAALASPDVATCAAARAAAARSAGVAARQSHQLMGAMGMTREHPLHHVTCRIWAWRDAGGSERAWEQQVGEHVLRGADDDALWDLATGAAAVQQS